MVYSTSVGAVSDAQTHFESEVSVLHSTLNTLNLKFQCTRPTMQHRL